MASSVTLKDYSPHLPALAAGIGEIFSRIAVQPSARPLLCHKHMMSVPESRHSSPLGAEGASPWKEGSAGTVSLSPEDIRALVSAFEASDWEEMSLQYGDTRLDLSRSGRPPAAAGAPPTPAVTTTAPVATLPSAPSQPAAAAPSTASTPTAPAPAPSVPGHRVTSPSLGLFWRSPQPGAAAFVEVGQRIDAEDTVCIVEVMKLMNHVKAGVAGTVVAIEVDNGAMVEFGATLVVIDPES